MGKVCYDTIGCSTSIALSAHIYPLLIVLISPDTPYQSRTRLQEHLEASYGGILPDVTTIDDIDAFFSEGYWEKYNRGVLMGESNNEVGQCEVDDNGTCVVVP